MKRTLTFTLLLCCVSALDVYAQCGVGKPHELRMNIECQTLASLRNKGVTMHGYDLDIGISVYKNFYVLGSFDLLSHHNRNDKQNTFVNSIGLAGGLTFNVIDKEQMVIPLKIKMGHTLGKSEWEYTYYDTSIGVNPRIGTSKVALVFSMGYRFTSSHSSDMCNHGFVYWSVGLKL